ncbi:MAG: hypothetical protein CVU08_13015 [Bacteroidetes bacterium HGW-Bacteroidetes-3]|nr:MAG: hypothetical protein CVU08_13015 [Bacteroidetes bacterium HGW-Bacteroidetes-3]
MTFSFSISQTRIFLGNYRQHLLYQINLKFPHYILKYNWYCQANNTKLIYNLVQNSPGIMPI